MKLFLIKKNKDIVGCFLVILNIAGAIGLSNEFLSNLFLSLVPYNLILTFLLCFVYVSFKKYYIPIFLIVFTGFFIEVIGVKTGILFGIYTYGDTLGFKILEVPVVIGLNWLVLCLSIFSLFSVIFKNKFLLLIFSSISMVLLDFIIEPVAIEYSFWSWSDNSVPIQNYIMWFVVSLVMNYILLKYRINVHYKLGLYLVLSQLFFFLYLLMSI